MKITSQIQHALRLYLDDHGYSNRSFAKCFGVSNVTISRWLNTVKGAANIKPEHWLKLKPLIERYLPEDYNAYPTEQGGALEAADGVKPADIPQDIWDLAQDILELPKEKRERIMLQVLKHKYEESGE